ncbi:hypothetical protein KQI65_03050 [bacterium]|nr:hypothetical protein [bacterium]
MFPAYKNISLAAGIVMFALLLGFSASAQGQGKSEKMPYGLTFNLCNGELIETTGNLNFVANIVEDENGCVTFKYHYNTQNVRGIGLDTGDEYRIIDVGLQKGTDVTVCGGCLLNLDIVSTWRVIAKDGTSSIVHQVLTLQIDICTFEFSVVEKHVSIECE